MGGSGSASTVAAFLCAASSALALALASGAPPPPLLAETLSEACERAITGGITPRGTTDWGDPMKSVMLKV